MEGGLTNQQGSLEDCIISDWDYGQVTRAGHTLKARGLFNVLCLPAQVDNLLLDCRMIRTRHQELEDLTHKTKSGESQPQASYRSYEHC